MDVAKSRILEGLAFWPWANTYEARVLEQALAGPTLFDPEELLEIGLSRSRMVIVLAEDALYLGPMTITEARGAFCCWDSRRSFRARIEALPSRAFLNVLARPGLALRAFPSLEAAQAALGPYRSWHASPARGGQAPPAPVALT